MRELVTAKDVRIAWNAWNDLPKPETSSSPQTFNDREAAWVWYVKARDQLLYQLGTLRAPIETGIWHYGDGLKKH